MRSALTFSDLSRAPPHSKRYRSDCRNTRRLTFRLVIYLYRYYISVVLNSGNILIDHDVSEISLKWKWHLRTSRIVVWFC